MRYQRFNDFVGWVIHSFLIVPYFSWKPTHTRHHRYTGHIEKGTVFVPWTDDELAKKLPLWYGTPIMRRMEAGLDGIERDACKNAFTL